MAEGALTPDSLSKERAIIGNAPRIVLWLGILMVLVGLTSRYILGVRGVNGFTPLLLGMPIAVLSVMALDPLYRQPTLRWVAGLALLGLILTLNVLPHLQALLRGE